MGIFDKLFGRNEELISLDVSDEDIVAIADGKMIDITSVSDPMFAEEVLGKSVAFSYESDKVTLCSPANGTLKLLFPTGHAFGIMMKDGVELLIHCGIDTVNSKGDGFRILKKKQGDPVRAGDPIVEVDIKKLSASYDMSTILIITDPKEKEFEFIDLQDVVRGQSLLK